MREAEERQRIEAEESQARSKAQAEWEEKLRHVRRQEKEALDDAALPLRTFLMRHVMPTLTEVSGCFFGKERREHGSDHQCGAS